MSRMKKGTNIGVCDNMYTSVCVGDIVRIETNGLTYAVDEYGRMKGVAGTTDTVAAKDIPWPYTVIVRKWDAPDALDTDVMAHDPEELAPEDAEKARLEATKQEQDNAPAVEDVPAPAGDSPASEAEKPDPQEKAGNPLAEAFDEDLAGELARRGYIGRMVHHADVSSFEAHRFRTLVPTEIVLQVGNPEE